MSRTTALRLPRRRRSWAALAALALLWQALLPVAQAMQPRAWVTLCTSTGLRTLPADDGGASHRAADHCALCRLSASAGDAPLVPPQPVLLATAVAAARVDAPAQQVCLPAPWQPRQPRAPPR